MRRRSIFNGRNMQVLRGRKHLPIQISMFPFHIAGDVVRGRVANKYEIARSCKKLSSATTYAKTAALNAPKKCFEYRACGMRYYM